MATQVHPSALPEAGPSTRHRILESAIELLAEDGYAGTSTRLVAARAGVSQGALQHHFPSKSGLFVSAMTTLAQRLSDEFVAAIPSIPDPVERFAAILDRLLTVFTGPAFAAGLELRLAARAEPELRLALDGLDLELDQIIEAGAVSMIPEFAGDQRFGDLLALTMASLRGVALLQLDPDREVEGSWSSVRAELLRAASGLGETG